MVPTTSTKPPVVAALLPVFIQGLRTAGLMLGSALDIALGPALGAYRETVQKNLRGIVYRINSILHIGGLKQRI
jgi:hypothetical protein